MKVEGLAPHVAAAIRRVAEPRPAAQAKQTGRPAPAPHVVAAVQAARQPRGRASGVQAKGAGAAPAAAVDYVTYVDVKAPTTPPPPPRYPVYAMTCADGKDCSLRDVKTGRVRPAGDMYAGYVRMSKGGPIYLSPRPGVGLQGDSHPSIASMTPEESGGRKPLVAAGEVGILDGEIVGHNDKTGHYRTRKNLRQAGMPPDKFHPFTEDPADWYKKPERR